MSDYTSIEETERQIIVDMYKRRGAPYVLQALASAITNTANTFDLSEDERQSAYEAYQYQFKWALAAKERELKTALYKTFQESEG